MSKRNARFWREWLSITRLINSAQIAFNTEISQWSHLTKDEMDNEKIRLDKVGRGKYTVSIAEHLKSLKSEHLFCAMILQYSCGMIEEHGRSAAKDLISKGKIHINALSISSTRRSTMPMEDHVSAFIQDNPAEIWSDILLNAYGHTWAMIEGDQSGISEVVVIRNAISHGIPRVNRNMINRIKKYTNRCSWKVGDPIQMNLMILQEYRSRLRSLARCLNGD